MKVFLCFFALSTGAPAVAWAQGLGLPPIPPGNPITPEKALLGKALFWDEQVSSTRGVSCATCHIPAHGMSDPRSALADARRNPGPDGLFGTEDDKIGSPGVNGSTADGSFVLDPIFRLEARVGTRKTLSTINAAFFTNLFWDARIETEIFFDPISGQMELSSNATLENLIVEPPLNVLEMSHHGRDWGDIVPRIESSAPLALAASLSPDLEAWLAGRPYVELFEEAFGTPEVSAPRIIMAIATYLRTLISDQAPIDEFLAGDNSALTQRERRGLDVFLGFRCTACHTIPLFSDDLFHNTGVRPPAEDFGRGAISGDPAENAMFRTPSLRNVGLREPLFHHGRMARIEDVVEFYNRGGDFPQDPNSDPLIEPMQLTNKQKRDLAAFLRGALTDPRVELEQPPFDRPILWSESDKVPVEVGAGLAGSGGFVPQMIAGEPPLIGNPSLTIGVDRGLGGAPAFFVAWVDFGAGAQLFVFNAGALQGAGEGEGWNSLTLAIPDEALLAGIVMNARWFLGDAGAAKAYSASQTFAFEFF